MAFKLTGKDIDRIAEKKEKSWRLRRLEKAGFLAAAAVFLLGIGLAVMTRNKDQKDQADIVFDTLTSSTQGAVGHNSAPDAIFVDVGGAVERPGVYELGSNARVKDALVAAGGLAEDANREYVSKNMNLAAPAPDGAKVYVPFQNEKYYSDTAGVNTAVSGLVNINTVSSGELEKLKGIGEVRAKAIVDNRPYLSVDELRTKGVLGQKTFENIKDSIAVY